MKKSSVNVGQDDVIVLADKVGGSPTEHSRFRSPALRFQHRTPAGRLTLKTFYERAPQSMHLPPGRFPSACDGGSNSSSTGVMEININTDGRFRHLLMAHTFLWYWFLICFGGAMR